TSVTISKALTTTKLNFPSTVEYGTSVGFAVTVLSQSNGAPMGTGISFLLDGQPLNTGGDYGALSDPPPYRYIQFATSEFFNSTGTHTIVAQYAGDTNYAPSASDPVTFTVTP